MVDRKIKEAHVKNAVKGCLNKRGAYYFMPMQNGMGAPGLDFHCCYRGRAFAIETKAPGKKMTPRQENTRDKMNGAGMAVLLIDTVDMTVLENFLYSIDLLDGAKGYV